MGEGNFWMENQQNIESVTHLSMTPDDFCKLVTDHLQHQPLIKNDWVKINEMIHKLPVKLTNIMGFEKALDLVDSPVDISISIDPDISNAERDMLLKCRDSLCQQDYNTSIWKRIDKFTELWSAQSSLINTKVKEIWLEFDECQFMSKCPEPCIFITSDDIVLQNDQDESQLDWISDEVFLSLLDDGVNVDEVKACIVKCIRVLPKDSRVYLLGMMLTRSPSGVYLVVDIRLDQILQFLKRMDWAGDYIKLQKLISELTPHVGQVLLSMSIGERVEPKIGIECYENTGFGNSDTFRWRAFIEYLVSHKYCLTQLKEDLLNFNGSHFDEIDNNFIAQDNETPNKSRSSKLYRGWNWGINHVKIVLDNSGEIKAKAYLYAVNVLAKVNLSNIETQ